MYFLFADIHSMLSEEVHWLTFFVLLLSYAAADSGFPMPQLVAVIVLVGLTRAGIVSSSAATVSGANPAIWEGPTVLTMDSAGPIP
ncbi:uncharacterized protein BP01DRAFT_93301 [Aspergillus saccharolyticus JOP 1030-1]|uniref:Uncharacterized protein n=1 Tax=Aspergillus saccharolyticus JOP 1030-1 TaxID=1450539 RepID=A0A318ZJA2_9EURO|nr:hypothetical protein BP01DRAFT_93301 [Aspergillus saccharolyticus JOP 1030-1]PYH43810.1 hypothetical protein BP01DRAFT_93301 [Aspergillus saccharolyticus JOP 1030-1]